MAQNPRYANIGIRIDAQLKRRIDIALAKNGEKLTSVLGRELERYVAQQGAREREQHDRR